MFKTLSALLFLIQMGATVCEAQLIHLTDEPSTYSYAEYSALLDRDDQDSLDWDQVYHLAPNNFIAYQEFQIDRPTQWIRLKVNNTTEEILEYYHFLYHNVDYVDCYLIDSAGKLLTHQSSGTLVKIDDRPYQANLWNHCILQNEIPTGQSTILLRVENIRRYTLEHRKINKLSFIASSTFEGIFEQSHYLSGLFFGYFLAIMFICVVLYLSDRKSIYLQSALFLMLGMLYPFAIDGYLFQMFFPNHPELSIWAENFAPLIIMSLYNWIAVHYLNIKKIAPKSYKVQLFLTVVSLILFYPAMNNVSFYNFWVVGIGMINFYTIYYGIIGVKHRVRQAYYFTAGYAVVVFYVFFGFFLRYFDVITYDIAIQYYKTQPIGLFLFSCLFLANIDRYRRTRKEEYELNLANERAINKAETERRVLIEKQNRELEQNVIERTREIAQKNIQLEKLDEMKSRFFSNISHEFRTPLTLIMGPAKNQLKKAKNDPKSKQELETILASADQLLELINQLLELSKTEDDSIQLNLKLIQSKKFVDQQLRLFYSMAENKKIHLIYHDVDDFEFQVDEDKMRKTFSNVVYNALKFSPDESTILVKAYHNETSAFFEIIDEGPGIPDEAQEKIFERFYQLNNSDTTKGTGIGLALAKVYVTLHGGSIHVEKNIPMGSKFIIELPRMHTNMNRSLSKSHPSKDERNLKTASDMQPVMHIDNKKTNILIVEDEELLREFIQSCFDDDYQVHVAQDGKEGLALAQRVLPDVIVSDVMMPKMDGITMTDLLKKDMLTSHIPVLLLTAKASVDSKVAGLSAGSDDYLTKPFDNEELVARVKTLIRNRNILYEKYGQAIQQPSDENVLPDIEQKFLNLVINDLEKNMDNDQYDVEKLSENMKINRTTLYRKLKAVSGQTPTAFIKTIRLQRAKQMLEEGQMNVSEIAFAVGFSSVAHFSSSFKEVFGVTPSAYVV